MEYILFGYVWTILFHISRNKMVLPFEVALNIEKQDLTTSLHEKRTYFLKTQYLGKAHKRQSFNLYKFNLLLLRKATFLSKKRN